MVIRYQDKGEHVLQAQKLLNLRGFQLQEDGIFGPKTFRAVKAYQLSQGLSPTGVISGVTMALLLAKDRIEEEILLGSDSTFPNRDTIEQVLQKKEIPEAFISLTNVFWEVSATYNIKVGFMIAHAALESNWGLSRIAKERNNYFGFMVLDQTPEKARVFESPGQGIEVYARYIASQYLIPSGKWFAGATLNGMNVWYASDKQEINDPLSWAEKIGIIWQSLRE